MGYLEDFEKNAEEQKELAKKHVEEQEKTMKEIKGEKKEESE